MQFIKIIVLIVAMLGFYLTIKRRNKIRKEFIPIIIISVITIVEFLAGILNLMKITTILIVLSGVILAIYEFLTIIKRKEKLQIDIGIIIFAIFICLFAYLLIGAKLLHYDNFSHWGTIVKELLIENKLPNFESDTILFTSYPPATACFIYFCCKFLGNSESAMLFAQSMLILTSLYTIFALCKKDKKITYLIGCLAFIYLLLGNIFIDELLVDTVLPVMGIAAFVIIIYYQKDLKKGLLCSIPVLSVLTLVKNSGIFFVLVDLTIWIIYFIKQNGIKGFIKEKYIMIILLPFFLQLLWNGHIGLVFEEPDLAKHSMSVSNYITNIKEKGIDNIIFIGKKFVKEMTSLQNIENIVMPLFIIYFINLLWMYRKNSEMKKIVKNTFIFMLISYGIYQISLLAMYIFSMPMAEAEKLASYSRYYRTILLFEYGIVITTTLRILNNGIDVKKERVIETIIIILTMLLIVFSPNKLQQMYQRNFKEVKIREEISQFKEKGLIPEEKSYFVYVGDDERYTLDYIYHMWCYEYRSPRIRVVHKLSELENKKELEAYEYFIVLKSTEELEQFLKVTGGVLEENVIRYK